MTTTKTLRLTFSPVNLLLICPIAASNKLPLFFGPINIFSDLQYPVIASIVPVLL